MFWFLLLIQSKSGSNDFSVFSWANFTETCPYEL